MSVKGRAREIVLGIALLILVTWLILPSAPPQVVGEVVEATDQRESVLEAIRVIKGRANIEEIDPQPANYDGGGRNLFDYGVVKPPPPSPEELERRRKEAEERARREAEARAEAERLRRESEERQREAQRLAALRARQDTAPPAPPPKPVPPTLTLKFIGVVGEPDHEIAIFLDGTDFLLATVGETVKEAFRVEQIGYESLKMGYTDPQFEGEHKLMRLGG